MSAVKTFKEKLAMVKQAAESAEIEKAMQEVMTKLGPKVPLSELKMGVKVEQEHGPNGPLNGAFDVTGGDITVPVFIAAAHLAELPDYYTRLAHMEKEGEEELDETEEAKND